MNPLRVAASRKLTCQPLPRSATESQPGMINLSGKAAIITGAARGIGGGTANTAAEAGAQGITINYHRDREAAAQVAARCEQLGARVLTFRANVSRPAALERMGGRRAR